MADIDSTTPDAAKPTKRAAPKLATLHLAALQTKAQIRVERNEKADSEFEESVRTYGVMQPILVRPVSEGIYEYTVIAGHRRVEAARAVGHLTIPALIVDVDEDEARARQIVENVQRLDITLSDLADAVWDLYNGAAGASAAVLSAMVGRSRAWVSKLLTLHAPTKANTVARSLMARDQLGDLDMAYTICQVEELDKGVAQTIATNIANENRESVKGWLRQVKAQAAGKPVGEDGETEADEGEEDAKEGGEEGAKEGVEEHPKDSFVINLERGDLAILLKAFREATVTIGELSAKKRILAALTFTDEGK